MGIHTRVNVNEKLVADPGLLVGGEGEDNIF